MQSDSPLVFNVLNAIRIWADPLHEQGKFVLPKRAKNVHADAAVASVASICHPMIALANLALYRRLSHKLKRFHIPVMMPKSMDHKSYKRLLFSLQVIQHQWGGNRACGRIPCTVFVESPKDCTHRSTYAIHTSHRQIGAI